MKKAVLFDLDGTLLPMDQNVFVKAYFGELCKFMHPYGYDGKKLIDAVWHGTGGMVRNTGEKSNEKVFWEHFCSMFGPDAIRDEEHFRRFYETKFNLAKEVCGFNPASDRLVKRFRQAGLQLVLASNPIFPMVAQKNRMQWAGLDPDDFSYITSYENSSFCKPNPAYFRELLEKLELQPQECLMIGNDVREDVPAASVGMDLFLLTDCLINSENADYSAFPSGDMAALLEYAEEICGGEKA